MTKRSWQGASVRTTISMNRELWRDAKELMKKEGYNDNFSSFVTELIRRERTRLQIRDNKSNKEEKA